MKRKLAVIHASPRSANHKSAAANLASGLTRHGYDVEIAGLDDPKDADLVAMWSGRQKKVISAAEARGTPLLIMERGNLPPRLEWVSCGFAGMLRNGIYPDPLDDGGRCEREFAPTLRPWRNDGDGYALLIDQVSGPMSLPGPFDHAWTAQIIAQLRRHGREIRYRRHPSAIHFGDNWLPEGLNVSDRSIEADLAEAALCITYNSSVACEAIVAGVPTIACEAASMAWDVTTRDLDTSPWSPNRMDWLNRLAWSQWRPEEIACGSAWDALAPIAERMSEPDSQVSQV